MYFYSDSCAFFFKLILDNLNIVGLVSYFNDVLNFVGYLLPNLFWKCITCYYFTHSWGGDEVVDSLKVYLTFIV